MKQEKLLIIGAGIGQIPMIERAKRKGIYTIVASVKGNYPGFDAADESWYVDIYDREEILRRSIQAEVTAVISDQNDLMMPTVAFLSEKLGVPGNHLDQVLAFCNKNNYRENCDRLGIPGPKHCAVRDSDILKKIDFPLPWVIKPADSQSSIAVREVHDLREAEVALKEAISASVTKTAIVEEFFVGDEVVCEGFISEGKYYNLCFADRKYFDLKNMMIPNQTVFPATLDESIKNKIIGYESQMAAYVNPLFGIVHSEWLINRKTGKLCSIESALRGGGVYISSHLVPYATGIDINEVLLLKVLGRPVDINHIFEQRKDAASAYVCFYLPEGTVRSIHGIEEIERWDCVKMVALNSLSVGMASPKLTFKGQRLGPILVTGKDRDDLENNIRLVQQQLRIEVEGPDHELRGIIWE